ncbi:unnamed protein product, partial [Amoebophrya sp. A120]
KQCRCPHGDPHSSTCPAHDDVSCDPNSCSGAKWRSKLNFPANGLSACYPKCGTAANQNCGKTNGVHFIPSSNENAYCSGLSAAQENALLLDGSSYPTAACRESCCAQGCKIPTLANLKKINQGQAWSGWAQELGTSKFAVNPNGAKKSISGVTCNAGR